MESDGLPESVYWSACPFCRSQEHGFDCPTAFEIYQVCLSCGHRGTNQHYLRGES